MPRLPTITLRHKRSGKIEKRNQMEYAANIGKWATSDWEILTRQRGDATDAQVREAQREWKVNKHRSTDPKEQKWRGDQERAFKERAIKDNVVTIRDEVEPPSDVEPASEPDDSWQTLPWFKARAWIKARTGTLPKNKEHAKELMKDK